MYHVLDTKNVIMHAKVQKWGNSLALRIPKAIAIDAQLENDSMVDISVVEDQIIVKPLVKSEWTLEDLLAGSTKKIYTVRLKSSPLTGKMFEAHFKEPVPIYRKGTKGGFTAFRISESPFNSPFNI